MDEFEKAKGRLIEHVRRVDKPFNPTVYKRKAQALADKLAALVDELDGQSVEVFDLEHEHDKAPTPDIGLDGDPVTGPDYRCSFNATVRHLQDLAKSAARVAESYPDPRRRRAIPDAALGLLWLRYRHGMPRPTLYTDGDDVQELATLCEAAGIERDGVTLRNALAGALKAFDPHDPHMPPPWLFTVLTGER